MAKKRRKASKKTAAGKKKVRRSSWSRAEVEKLKKLFANNSTRSIARQLRRTEKSVGQKAARLRLKKSKRYMKSLGRK